MNDTTVNVSDYTRGPRVAYFSMEIALRSDIPTYAGGLGILAGDTIRSCADLEIPMVAVSLVSHGGYFRQQLDERGRQIEQVEVWDPSAAAKRLRAKITVPIEGRDVWVAGWLYTVTGTPRGKQPVILLDTDLDENDPSDRELTHYLYGDGEPYRLKQEIVLGIGGVRMLQALGFHIYHYHMNEGHSALLALELLNRHALAKADLRAGESPYHIAAVREICSFTTHTPVEAGHDRFSYALVANILGEFIDIDLLKRLAGSDCMNMTRLALNLSEKVNGVTGRHAETAAKLFPGYSVRAITNGVHPATWTSPPFARLYDRYLPGWCREPELLVRAECCISDVEILAAHGEARQALINAVWNLTGVTLDAQQPIIGFARRMTAYKQPDLIFRDMERLQAIAAELPFQLVFAGKAHPKDEGGKELIKTLFTHARELAPGVTMVFLPDYGMELARLLVSGVDLWLNTPLRPLEASGTSGMKASFNAVPSFSVLDGWWIEGCIEGITGWAIGATADAAAGDDSGDLYAKLSSVILPMYYRHPEQWVKVMQGAISKNASFFNSHRMMRRYVTETYVR